MKQKNIKVAYTSRNTGGSYTQVPKIQMEGRWLEELGFSIVSTIVVEYDDSSIRIRQMTEEELADRRREELEKELAAKSASIRKLKKSLNGDLQALSLVAESSHGYRSHRNNLTDISRTHSSVSV